ncbi:hypothetical protein [Actinospica acidiphila]|nr:hypothetical protein [Actinospica acidiphila]
MTALVVRFALLTRTGVLTALVGYQTAAPLVFAALLLKAAPAR